MDTPGSFDQLKAPPIFVIGAARSGTTWVLDIFGSHPQVARAKETWLFTRERGLATLLSAPHYPPRHEGWGQYITRDQMVETMRGFARTLLEYAIKPEDQFLVEKSPSHTFAIELIHDIFPDSRFVHVIRDGRDVAVSVRAAARSWAKQWRKSFGKSVAASGRAWTRNIRVVRRSIEELNLADSYYEIRYEDIYMQPLEGYARLFDFCDIPYDQDILQTIFQATDFQTNFSGGARRFRRHGRTGDWHRQFTWWNALAFNVAAGDMLIELGYEQNRRWLPDPRRWVDVS